MTTQDEFEQEIERETPYWSLTPLGIEDAARRRVLAQWVRTARERLLGLASDPEAAGRLWDRFASREPTMYQRLAKLRQLLISHKLVDTSEALAVDLEPPKPETYKNKALHIKR